MSAKKIVDSTIPEDENTDSGFVSGLISSEQNISEEIYREEESKERQDAMKKPESTSKDVISEKLEYDSGLISMECLSGEIDLQQESTPCALHVPEQPLIVIDSEESLPIPPVHIPKDNDLPPIHLLFEQDEDGDTQLHIAAVHGCEKSVATLIRVCPDRELLDIRNNYGHTALHLAVLAGHPYVTKMLVGSGASIGIRDYNGETPLHIAVQKKYLRSLKYLLSPIVEHPPRRFASVLDQKNYKGQTCIHLAAAKGYLEEVRTLVSHGANVNAQEGLAGRTALHMAAQRGDVALAAYLLADGGAARHARDYAGRSARRLARRTPAAPLFDDCECSDDDSDSEYESDSERQFEEVCQMMATCTTTC